MTRYPSHRLQLTQKIIEHSVFHHSRLTVTQMVTNIGRTTQPLNGPPNFRCKRGSMGYPTLGWRISGVMSKPRTLGRVLKRNLESLYELELTSTGGATARDTGICQSKVARVRYTYTLDGSLFDFPSPVVCLSPSLLRDIVRSLRASTPRLMPLFLFRGLDSFSSQSCKAISLLTCS